MHEVDILVIGEHPVCRWGAWAFIRSLGTPAHMWEASSAAEAIQLAETSRPSLVILDLALADARELTRSLTKDGSISLLGLGEGENWASVETFLSAGGRGYLPKRAALRQVAAAVAAMLKGKEWVSPDLRTVEVPSSVRTRFAGVLSNREMEVAVLIARGMTSRQIASQLCISLKTVETHRYKTFRKLRVSSRRELVALLTSGERPLPPSESQLTWSSTCRIAASRSSGL